MILTKPYFVPGTVLRIRTMSVEKGLGSLRRKTLRAAVANSQAKAVARVIQAVTRAQGADPAGRRGGKAD